MQHVPTTLENEWGESREHVFTAIKWPTSSVPWWLGMDVATINVG